MNGPRPAAEAGLSDPRGSAWGGVRSETIALAPVPLAAQPTAYVRRAWEGRRYGETPEARVAAAADADRLYVRLEWAARGEGSGEFPDAASVIFPHGRDGSLATLGAPEAPLSLWYWDAARPAPCALVARGPGVFRPADRQRLAAKAVRAAGRWTLVLSGPREDAADRAIGVAVWDGSNEERSGLAAVSRRWLTLELD